MPTERNEKRFLNFIWLRVALHADADVDPIRHTLPAEVLDARSCARVALGRRASRSVNPSLILFVAKRVGWSPSSGARALLIYIESDTDEW